MQEPSHGGHMMEGAGEDAGRPTCRLLLQDEFPVREDLSDETDEDAGPTQPLPPPKPPVSSFRLKNDSDLFGLGLVETGRKEISDEGSLGARVGWGSWGACQDHVGRTGSRGHLASVCSGGI